MLTRTGVLVLSTILAASSLACAKPGEKEQSAEGRANMQADEKIAAARADFERSREDYRHSRQKDLADLDRDIATLDARDRTATDKARSDLDANLPVIHAQRETFVRDLKSLDVQSPATWDASRQHLDDEWNALKTNVRQAL